MDVTKPNRDIKSLKPIAQKAAQMFLDECKKQGINIFVTEYMRPQERQDYLYEQGRTRPGKIVTQTRKSNHTSGYAWDIACNPPSDLYDERIIKKAGEVARNLGIEWGGDWVGFKDTPHFQVSDKWQPPKEDTMAKVPQYQIDALKSLCKEFNLDEKLWMDKIDKGITVGEFFAILRKVIK